MWTCSALQLHSNALVVCDEVGLRDKSLSCEGKLLKSGGVHINTRGNVCSHCAKQKLFVVDEHV